VSTGIKRTLLWIAVLPAAVGAYAGVALLTVIARHLNGDFEWVAELSSSIFSPIAFVYAGAKTAPAHRGTTAIALTVLHAMILAAMFGFIAYGLFVLKFQFKDPVWWSTMRAIIGVVVTICACVAIGREEHNQRQAAAIPIALRDAFSAARARYEQSLETAKPYTTLAKHRASILRAHSRRVRSREVAAYADPADFVPYTEAELESYTVKMENLTANFDNLTVAVTTLDSVAPHPEDEFYITALGCFNLYCMVYKNAVEDYKTVALSAVATATADKAQARKDAAKAWIKAIAINPDAEVETTDVQIKAERFEEKARIAETKAEEFLAKAKRALGE
jgi:Kef-type K+ transport system membrane component KefB